MKILILSTVHRWNDPRIFHKQACSLAKQHDVTLVAIGEGPERVVNGVRVRLIGTWKSHKDRLKLWWPAYREILRSKADAVHFHDPELALLLIPLAFLGNKKLVYDVHEDPTGGYGGRSWIPKFIRKPVAFFVTRLLKWSPTIYDDVLLAEESYAASFPDRKNVHIVRNYPIIPDPDVPFVDRYEGFDPQKEVRILYLGQLIVERGALKMVEMAQKLAEKYPNFTLDLVGEALPPSLDVKMKEAADHSDGHIKLHGYCDFFEASPLMQQAHIGLIPLQPHPNNLGSLVTKFYDYMTYGLPFVASNFPLWERFIADNSCGITADPTDPDSFAQAICSLIESPDRLREYSMKGYQLVRERYSWKHESEILGQIYG